MKKTLVHFIFLFVTLFAVAQEDNKGTIDAQRPTLTESYSIIVPNMLQFENGLDHSFDTDTLTVNTFVRGSISRRVELRMLTDYRNLNAVGAKFIALEPEGSALGIGASFVYSRDLQNNQDDFRLAMTKDFTQFFMTYNFGYYDDIYHILLVGLPINSQVNYFIEYYNNPAINRIHSGVTWIPKRDIQLDINGGWIDTDGWYAGLGASFRIR